MEGENTGGHSTHSEAMAVVAGGSSIPSPPRPSTTVDPRQFSHIVSWQPDRPLAPPAASSVVDCTPQPSKALRPPTGPSPRVSGGAGPSPVAGAAAGSPAVAPSAHTPLGPAAVTPAASATPSISTPDAVPSFVVNGKVYRKLEALGKGGSSKVYKVRGGVIVLRHGAGSDALRANARCANAAEQVEWEWRVDRRWCSRRSPSGQPGASWESHLSSFLPLYPTPPHPTPSTSCCISPPGHV
jgi:hypothetical protein